MRNRLKTSMLIVLLTVLSESGLAQQEVFNSPVYAFVERYFAQLLSKPSKQEQLNLLSEDRVVLKMSGLDFKESRLALSSILSEINDNTPLTVNENEKEFQFIWVVNEGLQTIEFRFPKQYDLILGKDKRELTQSFQSDLEAFAYEFTPAPVAAEFGSIEFYLIPQMKSGQYLQQRNGEYVYLLNERMGKESLLNLFSNAHKMNRKNALAISVKGYDTNVAFPYTLDRFCAYMQAAHCQAFVGLETENDKEYTGTVLYVNRELMYNHLVYFRFPKTAFMREQETTYIKVYPYIPVNNIGDLYEDISKEMKNNN